MSPLEILQHYWNYDSFRPLQEEIITSVLEGHDTLALLPTGGGKSICYQIPALAKEGLCLVVSPLIALMKDQVQQLRKRAIPAEYIVSSMSHYEIELALNQCIFGNVKFLYVSPERLQHRVFIEHFKQMKISLIAVDEAHCISQWGYDFRPPYTEIAKIRSYHPQAPILALTATATASVVTDIQQQLNFHNQRIFRTSFYRENLSFMVIKEEDKNGRLLRILNRVQGSAIVYVRNRRKTKEIADFLVHYGIPAESYHAGMEQKERDLKQSVWQQSHRCVMVATNAFGMGIDKPDVRAVIHLDIPSSIEAYFQEAGRGGRDGKKAYAVLLYDANDIARLDQNFEQDFPPQNYIRAIYKTLCNYYQIPIGSGEGCEFDFEWERICQNYNLNPTAFFSATKFLEREGLISLPDRSEMLSRLFIRSSRETLYRYELEKPRNGEIIKTILRLYGGLFTDFVEIMESQIAKRVDEKEERVIKALQEMQKLELVSYRPKTERPQIIFTSERINENDIIFAAKNYQFLKSRAEMRKEEMKRYIFQTDMCRSQFLCQYFDDNNVARCGICDTCLKQKVHPTDCTNLIHSLLEKQPQSLQSLLNQLNQLPKESTIERIRELIDHGTITIDRDYLLHWNH